MLSELKGTEPGGKSNLSVGTRGDWWLFCWYCNKGEVDMEPKRSEELLMTRVARLPFTVTAVAVL